MKRYNNFSVDKIKELRELNNKFGIQFTNYKVIEKTLNPLFSEVIISNNLEDIIELISLLPKGVLVSPAQFLFQRKYMIENGDEMSSDVSKLPQIRNNIVTILDKLVILYKKQEKTHDKAEEILEELIKIDDWHKLSRLYSVTDKLHTPILANRIKELMDKE